jgi:hypothetical protein
VPVVPPPAAERSDLAAVRQAVPQFVGRAEDLEHMRRELSAPVALGGAFIVSIAGVGGVGKTSLLNQFLRQRVPTAIYVTADDRDRLTDAVALPRVLAQRLAAVLGAASHCARALAGPQRPPEGGAGPEGRPPEVSPEAPAVGAAGAAAEPTGGAAVDPVAALTDALIRDVNAAGAAGRSVVLVLDTYEGIRHVAGPWLLDTLLGGHLTPITGDLRLIISGREPLQRTDPRWLRDWDNSGRAILNVDLEPFSPAETAAYLGEASSGAAASGSAGEAPERGPPAEDVHAAHRMTGGLPVWLALWRQAWRRGGATSGAAPDMAAAEHVQMVVDRLLMWWQDPAQLRWVRTAWVPRWFNLEVLRVLVGAEAEAAFEWLTRQAAIVRGDRGRWQFHEVVRTALRQEALQRAPTELAALHDRLAEYWRGATSGPAPGPQGRGGRAAQEAIYHQLLGTDPGGGAAALCRAYVGGLAAADPALAEVVAAGGEARGHQWRGAGAALGLPAVAAVEAHWAALQAGDTTAAAAAWERLLALDAWPAAARALLLGERGDPRGGAADPAAPRAGLPARGTGVRQAPGTRVRPAWWQRRWWPGLGGVLASRRGARGVRRHPAALGELWGRPGAAHRGGGARPRQPARTGQPGGNAAGPRTDGGGHRGPVGGYPAAAARAVGVGRARDRLPVRRCARQGARRRPARRGAGRAQRLGPGSTGLGPPPSRGGRHAGRGRGRTARPRV